MEPSAFLLPLKPYLDAFVEHDSARRLDLLEQGLASSAEIWGPKRVFAGYSDISEKIEGFQRNWPNCRLVLANGVVCFNMRVTFPKPSCAPAVQFSPVATPS